MTKGIYVFPGTVPCDGEGDNLSTALAPSQQEHGDEVATMVQEPPDPSSPPPFKAVLVPGIYNYSLIYAPKIVPISPWLWGGIYVRTQAAAERFNAGMHRVNWAIWLLLVFVMALGSATVEHTFPSLLTSGSMASHILNFINFAVAFAFLKVLQAWFRPGFQVALQTDLEGVVQDLAPFIRGQSKFNLSVEVVPQQRECYEQRNHFTLGLVPLTDQEHSEEYQDACPLMWPSEDGSISRGEVEINVLHRWYMFSTLQMWNAAALQGHRDVDVFTWGLIYTELNTVVATAFQLYVTMAFMVGVFYGFFASSWAASIDDISVIASVVVLLSFVAVPWLLYEYWVAKASPDFHRRCQEAVQGLAPQVREKCSYDLEYKVCRGRLYGSTSTLSVFPVEAPGYKTIV